jgi:hypothetical protein
VLVFSRPLLTFAIVGVLIYSTLAFNYSMMLYMSAPVHVGYWENLNNHIVLTPFFGLLNFFIPFLAPLLVSTGAKKVGTIKTNFIMNQHPEMNPDIVLRVSISGAVFKPRCH